MSAPCKITKDILQDREISEEYQNNIKAKIPVTQTNIVKEWKLFKETHR
jgi:hypothetical protein